MKTLKLKNRFQANATFIANDFIDSYMPRANGEFVKVYLFLLRHWDDPCFALTISTIADCLDNTEKDILRAFRYWESEGLLLLERDADGRIIGLELKNCPSFTIRTEEPALPALLHTEPESPYIQPEPLSPALQEAHSQPPASDEGVKAICLDSFKAQKELKSLYFIAEAYLGKTLSRTDIDTITYFYDTLGMSPDLIEYLIGHCVENGHKSIHYIRKVALDWADAGVTTIEEARQHSVDYNKNCYTVLRAFGIKNRGAAPNELTFIRKWTEEYGFPLDIVEEACSRTISVTHQPSFEYADSILEKWHQKGVRHFKDIAALDDAFQKERTAKKTSASRNRTVPRNMNNFERRAYDMDSLEEKLLNSN